MEYIEEKLKKLKKNIKELDSCLIAFSGGVDSSFLVKVSYDVLKDKVLAITAKSSTLAQSEYDDAVEIAKQIGCRHEVIEYEELDDKEFRNNPKNRCYFCKRMLFSNLKEFATQHGYKHIIEGTNYDDIFGHRPGMIAAKEFNVISPLLDLKFTKNEIRYLSKKLGLKTYNKAEMACLSSRIPTNSKITLNKLRMVENAESFIKKFGVKQIRVRHFGRLAKIEIVKEDFCKLYNNFIEIEKKLKEIGFEHIEVDQRGYRRGLLVEIT